ncbi:MAG: hypothetical protein ACWGNV_02980 [Bacteroidales bacterium]
MKIGPLSMLLLLAFCPKHIRAGELPELLMSVLQTDTSFQSISCKIEVTLDVPGLSMPDKEIALRLEKGKKPRMKSEGITLLPKHGIIGQYRDFLETDCQAIPISENGDTMVYKVVSLDHKTDWTTVDMTITKRDAKIHSMLISTRKNGEYLVRHFYGDEKDFFPEQTEVSFEAMPLKLPLKFLGKQEGMEILSDTEGPVTGRIILQYSDITWEKSGGSSKNAESEEY